MGTTSSYTHQDFRQLWEEDLKLLPPRSQRLARALIVLGVYDGPPKDEDIRFEFDLDDLDQTGLTSLSPVFDYAFTPGRSANEARPHVMKVGNITQVANTRPGQ